MKTKPGKPPRVSARPNLKPLPRPRSLVQRKLRAGLPPTIGHRQAKAGTKVEEPPFARAMSGVEGPALGGVEDPPVSPVEAAGPQPPVTESANALLLRECWEVRYGWPGAIPEDSRGLRYIALLIGHAREDTGPIHAKELVALATGEQGGPIELERADQVLDAAAQR